MKPRYDTRAFFGLLLIIAGVFSWIWGLYIDEILGLFLGIGLAGTGMGIQIRRVTRREE